MKFKSTIATLALLGSAVCAAAFPDSPRTVLVAASNASDVDKSVAQFVCTGTNDEAVINQAIASLTKGGTVQLSDGDFYIDAFPNEGNSAIYFGYNNGVARAVTLRGGTQNKSYNTRLGTGLHVTEKAVKAMKPGVAYRAIYGASKTPPAPGVFFTMTHVNNVVFEQFYLLFHDASKSWRGIDGTNFGNMRITLVGVYTERYFQDRFLHVRPASPVPGSIGILSVPGSNDEMSDVGYEKVNVGGMHTGFYFQQVDHLVLTACSAARCCYGYHLTGHAPKTMTMINCCDEGNAHLPLFEGVGHLTAIDFNIERFNAAFIPLSTDASVNASPAEAFEKNKGGWRGFISYTMQGKAFGLKNFWHDGSGVNFQTVNLDHDRRKRSAHPDPGETYFDAKTRRLILWDVATKTWVDALGRPADETVVDGLSREAREPATSAVGENGEPLWMKWWDMGELKKPANVHLMPSLDDGDVRAIMLESGPWHGKPTRVFAYFALPKGASATKKVPGVVLVHGGLSSADKEWVKLWSARGYAAIAVDNCGGLPIKETKGNWRRHAHSGPPGWGRFATSGEPICDQWFYHAIAAVIRGSTFLHDLPEVDPRSVGIVGASWGGLLTCVAAAVDTRFAWATSAYGTGFLGDHDFVTWRLKMQGATPEQGERWLNLWDPRHYLAYVRCPFLWVDGTNDFHFKLDGVAKSAALVKDSVFAVKMKMPHSDAAVYGCPEIYAFADRHAKGANDVVRFTQMSVEDGALNAAFTAAGRKIRQARLIWTTGREADPGKRTYMEKVVAPFDAASGKIRVALPEGTTIAILALDTEDGLAFTSAPQVDPLRMKNVVIYGGTSAGIAAAVQATRMGMKATVVEPSWRIGGLTTGGLGQTDIGAKSAFGGLALSFYQDIFKWYADPKHWKYTKFADYSPDGQCAGSQEGKSMWTFEPSAALAVLEGWEKREGLEIIRGERLDRGPGGVVKKDGRIVSFRTESGKVFTAAYFIDATYEGDLMAAAGVKYAVGREPNAQYGETLNGIQTAQARYHQFLPGVDPYVVKGDKSSGLLPGVEPYDPKEKDGDGDRRVQGYCLRMCLTDVPENRIPFAKPADYNERDYELLFRDYEQRAAHPELNKGHFVGLPWINSQMPCRKTDTNNRLAFSTDFPGANWKWPEASYAEREKIFAAHLRRQQGLMWTLANHPRIPEYVRKEVSRWGTCKDEFLDKSAPGGGWQSQLYVREARRMVGDYVMTEADCCKQRNAPRPVAMGAYQMDSHNVRRRVGPDGFVHNEGDVEVGVGKGPYGIAYGAITPKKGECANLLVPVCVSASHIAYGSIRMEPVFFALGQAAGTAVALAVEDGRAVQDVDYGNLSRRLAADGQVFK